MGPFFDGREIDYSSIGKENDKVEMKINFGEIQINYSKGSETILDWV